MKTRPFLTKTAIALTILVTSTLLIFVSISLPKQTEINSNAEFENVMMRLEQEGFSGVVAISRDKGDATFVAGIGEKVTANGGADKDTLVDIGSVTKPITATAILRLVDDGQMSVADTLEDYFSNLPDDHAKITIHQLLTHSSGLPQAIGHDHDQDITKEVFLERTFQTKLLFEPGTAYEYSNVGYSLLAAIIEKTSGLSYEDFLHDVLLKLSLIHI